jgi:MFS family permease
VPFLEQAYGMPRVTASWHASVLLCGVAFGSLAAGAASDRLGSRRGVMRAYAFAYALSWAPWLVHVEWPLAATLAWFFLDGPLDPRVHALVDDREGSQPARALGHGERRSSTSASFSGPACCSPQWVRCSIAGVRRATSRRRGSAASCFSRRPPPSARR